MKLLIFTYEHIAVKPYNVRERSTFSQRSLCAWDLQESGYNKVNWRFMLDLIDCCRYILPCEIFL